MIRARRLRARSARCSWSSGARTHSFTLCGCLNLRGNVPCVRSLYTCPGATQVLRNADAEWSKKNGEQVEPFYEINSVSRTNVSITWPCETVYCVLVSSLLKDKCNRASVLKKVHIKYGKEEIKMPRSCTWSTRRWNMNSWNMCGSILGSSVCQCGRETERKHSPLRSWNKPEQRTLPNTQCVALTCWSSVGPETESINRAHTCKVFTPLSVPAAFTYCSNPQRVKLCWSHRPSLQMSNLLNWFSVHVLWHVVTLL